MLTFDDPRGMAPDHGGARAVTGLVVAFDARLPQARWGPLFHVFRLEHPDVTLYWRPVGLPTLRRPLLHGGDVGLFLHPPHECGLSGYTLDLSPMKVIVAAGHRLAHHQQLMVADVLDEPFVGGPALHPEWVAFWTLDEQRGAPPRRGGGDISTVEQGLEVVASGRAIATAPAWMADGLAHPGVVALPLLDGPQVPTRLLWRSGDDNPTVRSLVQLAGEWTAGTPSGTRHEWPGGATPSSGEGTRASGRALAGHGHAALPTRG